MATNLDDLEIIRTRFLTQWNAAVPVVLDNEPAIDEPNGKVWARFSVLPGAERRASIARNTYEQLGRVYLQVFIPDGEADKDGWALAEAFAATFRDWKSPDWRIRFDTPEYRTSKEAGDKDFKLSAKGSAPPFMILVTIPYTAQH